MVNGRWRGEWISGNDREAHQRFTIYHSPFTKRCFMEFELSEEQKQVKGSVREFAEAEIAPHVMEWDEAQHFPTELWPKLAELGLTGVIFPEEYGGAGM